MTFLTPLTTTLFAILLVIYSQSLMFLARRA